MKGHKKMNNRQPQPNGSYHKQNAPQRTAQQGTRPANSAQRPTNRQPQKKKLRFRPNKEGMISLCILIIVVITAIALITVGIKAIVKAVSDKPEETSQSSDTSTEQITPAGKWNDGYTLISVPTTDVAVGDLILVNFENEYALTDTLGSKQLSALYTSRGYGTYYVLKDAEVKVHTKIKTALQDMIFALVDANPDSLGNVSGEDRIFITSGYRSLAKQTELYEKKKGDNYVAIPGRSEHHTGLAVDIQVFTSDQKTVLLDDACQEWMEAHCADFGFIIRYDGSKFELTGILDEPWHYRYVGIPHATYMMESGLCMEEYLELLRKSHSYEKEPLTITTEDAEYIVYYVPASENATSDVPVPAGDDVNYTVSGDNLGGFIVTVEKAK